MSMQIDRGTRKPQFQVSYYDKVLHQLSLPVHNILILSDLLKTTRENGVDQTIEEPLELISSSANTLVNLISSLRNLEDIKKSDITYSFKEIDIVGVVSNTVKQLQPAAKKAKLELRFKTKVESLKIPVDKFWFEQLLTNLINNAIQYSQNGVVIVTVGVGMIQDRKNLQVKVSDQGVGIKPDELETIFYPLKRGTNSNGIANGSGIGLAICKEVVLAHRGNIHAKNNPDKGASFEFSIPITPASLT